MLDHLLLVACICTVIALIFYLFYWNRFVAYIIGLAIRLMYWNQSASSIWVEIGSIHFSILAGRILLKDFRYHSSNQTIKVVKSQISWRYWIRKPTIEEDISYVGGDAYKQTLGSLSCRVQVTLQGFEWFLYNRTEVYDNVVSQLKFNGPTGPSHTSSTEHRNENVASRLSFQKLTALAGSISPRYPPSMLPDSVRMPLAVKRAISWISCQLPSLDLKDLLPLGIEIIKGAIICGNPSAPNLLVAEFKRADGMYGIVQSRSKYDLYKQILSLKFENALICYVGNEDYEEPMIATGEIIHDRLKQCHSSKLRRSFNLAFSAFAKVWQHLLGFARTSEHSARRGHSRQAPTNLKKSTKSVDEEKPLDTDFLSLEYAVEHKLLETPVLDLSYYADVVGDVPQQEQVQPEASEPFNFGNGDFPPEWGMDIVVRGGFFRYGPWADRQRAALQRAFFPSLYHNIEPFPRLKPGDKRVWAFLKVFIELRDDTTLHIPFREVSKNWQWDGQVDVPRPRKREAASIHITAGDSSSISYIVPMTAGPTGYEPLLEVHLDSVAVTSSLNDIRLVSAESCRMRCELPSPLIWNGKRKWTFAVTLRQPVLYLIRDHINMLTDLARDWTAGPPTDYYRFVPMIYAFEFEMHHYQMNLYANDHNIIDKPLLKDENVLLTMQGARFRHETQIPSDRFRPDATTIPFFIETPDVALILSLPRWNTHALHAPQEGHSIGRASFFRIDGSYRYFAEVREDNTEQLQISFTTRDVALKALGWCIRYFMVLRDNYFGSFTHFSTKFEYLDKRKRGLPVGDPITQKYRPGTSNILHVDIEVALSNGLVILPAGLPGYEGPTQTANGIKIGTCLMLDVPGLHLQFRLHDYFMEMSLNIDATSGRIENNCLGQVLTSPTSHRSQTILLIDGIDITAHRLFGPQPRTAAYVCIWEIHLGLIKAILSASEAKVLRAAGNAFRLNFADSANAPAAEYLLPVDPDVTFVKLSLSGLDATWLAGNAAVALSFTRGLRVDSNDLAGKFHRKVTNVRLPHASLKVLLAASSEHSLWTEAADIEADAYLDIYSSPSGWPDTARAQAEFIHSQDLMTGRAKRMLYALLRGDSIPSGEYSRRGSHKNGLYLPQPRLSEFVAHHQKDLSKNFEKNIGERKINQLSESSRLPYLSESEDEQGVSEADRDARLAQTRSVTPIVPALTNDYERNMTSGDESDDEDLTDADSTQSDWSDGNNGRPFLQQYYHFTRHYVAPFLKTLSLWDRSPFILVQNVKFFDLSTTCPVGCPDQKPLEVIPGFHNEPDAAVFRFQCRQGLSIKITPLILPVVTRLVEDIETNVPSPELGLDAIMASYLDSFPYSKKARQYTAIDVRLSSVRVCAFQHILAIDEDPTASRNFDGVQHPHNVSIARADLFLDHLHVTGSSTDHNPAKWALATVFDHLSITLDTVIDRRNTTPSRGKAAFDLHLSCFQGELREGDIYISWDAVSAALGHMSPEYMASTGVAFARSIRELSCLHRQTTLCSSVLTKKIIYDVLTSSMNKSIVDPLSMIQPSYLVQSGRPHELRTDPTFKFLFHLRNCLWHITDIERSGFRSLQNDGGSILMDDIMPLLESRLMSLALDADASNIANLATLDILFPPPANKSKSKRLGEVLNTSSIAAKRISILIWDALGVSSSELTFGALVVGARVRKHELVEPPFLHSTTFSQTSLRDQGRQNIYRLILSISVGDISLTVSPHLMQFAQETLRVRRHYGGSITAAKDEASGLAYKDVAEALNVDVVFLLHCLRVQAAAENLSFELGTSGLQVSSSVLLGHTVGLRGDRNQLMNHTLLFDEVFLRARSPFGISRQGDHDILASLVFNGGKLNAGIREDPSINTTIRVILTMDSLSFNVPRSALRLYRFVEEWRADFLPDIETTLQALIRELRKSPTKPVSPALSHSVQTAPTLQVDGYVASFGVTLQVMHGTWLSWLVNDVVLYLNASTSAPRGSTQTFGLQLASQVFSISSPSSTSPELASKTGVKLELPTVSVTGYSDGSRIRARALVAFFHLKVKPSHWDTLLIVQQKFGQDFNDLMALIDETRRNKQPPVTFQKSSPSPQSWKYSGLLKMKGFRIGLEGPSSTVYLECEDIGGQADNNAGHAWNVRLSDLALSLASPAPGRDFVSNRSHRSAFFIIDFETRSGSERALTSHMQVLRVSVTRIHAVMQPSCIGDVGDFVDHMQAEMLDRQELRALELAAFKQKTKSIMRTFEMKDQGPALQERLTWLDKTTINLSVKNIGVAFPLTLGQDLEFPHTSSHDAGPVRAFLFSIRNLVFTTQRGESGQAIMKGFSFQFVSRFRQSVSSDFSGENHQTRNRLVYPEMTAQLRSDRSTTSRQIRVGASVSGFMLDLDSNIPDYVFSLIDVYRQGEERVAKLTVAIPWDVPTSLDTQGGGKPTAMLTSDVFASLTFLSGEVRVYNGSSILPRSRPAIQEPSDEQFLKYEADIFKLPVVSVWTEYRAAPALHRLSACREVEPSILMFKSTVHPSQNILRPTLLPFLTELVRHIDVRMRQVNRRSSSPTVRDAAYVTPSDKHDPTDSGSSTRISFSLRIDQSKLELTCQPDVNVIAGLHWDSGGFVVNVSPGARNITFTGSVGGLTAGLKHGFLSEDCVRLDARNLAFSVTFSKTTFATEHSINAISIALDTQFSGGVRFSRLQDVLCFKAVWLDRIPIFTGQDTTVARTPTKLTVTPVKPPPPKQEFIIVALLRIRQIKLEIDLGQSISAVSLDLEDLLIRTKLTETLSEVSMSVADIMVIAKGNVSGRASVPNCVFQTIRRKEGTPFDVFGQTSMLELTMTSGALNAVLESDHQRLLQYRGEPLEVEIYDDWSMISSQAQMEERPLRLSFVVSGTKIVAIATVGTIPKLLSYAKKFKANLDAQSEGASRESKAFRVARSPKPDNALSEVANAMIHSARTRFKEAETGLSYMIRQNMSLRLQLLRLVVFPRTMADQEIAQFLVRQVHARLDRHVESDSMPAKRDLHLSFASMTTSKFSQLNHTHIADPASHDGHALLLKDAPEAIVFGLPSMKMHMVSLENTHNLTKHLEYDFHSQFVRRDGMKDFEDIYITLNVSLYSWLTILRKNLSREMDQVQAAAGWRTGPTMISPTMTTRKKAPDPLPLSNNILSLPALSRASTTPLSALVPSSSIRAATMEQSKSASSAYPPFSWPPKDQTPNFALSPTSASPQPASSMSNAALSAVVSPPLTPGPDNTKTGIVYLPRSRHIERLTMRQLGEATPDVMHPFFMKKSGFNLEDSLPQYVHEYATIPLEEIMEVLLKLYSKQLRASNDAAS